MNIELRGKCKEKATELVNNSDNLRLVRGFYWCPVDNREFGHWWAVDVKTGKIHDPTSKQFHSNGVGEYREYEGGEIECTCCGGMFDESEGYYQTSSFVVCSNDCYFEMIYGEINK